MSKSLLKELGSAVSVIGLPGMPDGEAKVVGVNALTANILCRHHNTELNGLDAAAVEFFRIRKAIDKSFTKPSLVRSAKDYRIDGAKLERWILKMLAGLVLSGAAVVGSEKVRDLYEINRELLIEGLYRGRLPPRYGLSLAVGKDKFPATDMVQCGMLTAWNNPMKIVGGYVRIRGQHFEVVFDPDAGSPPPDRVLRPTLLQFSDGWRTHQISLKYKRPRTQVVVRVNLDSADWTLNEHRGA